MRAKSLESWRRGIAPAIIPLIVGFALLLGIFAGVGYLSVREMDTVSFQARDVGRQRSARLNLLWDLRLGVTRLDHEARTRARAEALRVELAPPFDFRLDGARSEVENALRRLDSPPLSQEQSWQQMREDLKQYVEITRDSKRYSLEGFGKFVVVDKQLNELFANMQQERDGVIDRVLAIQGAARRSIIGWTLIALLVGTMVTVGTIWQVQRHFSEMRRSVSETRRERIFTTQLLEGMVSAVAAIDEEDRIRSANAAFLRIFPQATIGASVFEKLGPDDAMKMLEILTAVRVTKATYHGRSIARVDDEDKEKRLYSDGRKTDALT